MQEELTLFPEGSPANHTPTPRSEKERKMIATSGRKCFALFERFSPVGSWERTFLGYFLGTEVWSSTRCSLIWKPKGIGRFLRWSFQLAVRTRPTVEIGSGLLPTVMAQTRATTLEQTRKRQAYYGGTRCAMYLENVLALGLLPTPRSSPGEQRVSGLTPSQKEGRRGLSLAGLAGEGVLPQPIVGLLPTPTAKTPNERESVESWTRRSKALVEKGSRPLGLNMAMAATMGVLPMPARKEGDGRGKQLPTPRESEHKGVGPIGSKSHESHAAKGYLGATLQEQTGKSFQLCHRYELEMMGFPVDWCDIPMELIADLMKGKSRPAVAKKP